MNDILTIKEVAEMLRLSENTLRWMRHQGVGPDSFKLGRRIVYYRTSVVAYIEGQIAKEAQRIANMRGLQNTVRGNGGN